MEKSDSERHLTINNQDGFGAAATQADGGLGDVVKFALDFARRRYLLILTGIIFALCIAAGYLKVAPPTYKATTKLLVENQTIQFLPQQSIVAQSSVDVAHLENQIEILKSKPIAVAVINKLNLASSAEFDKTTVRELGKWISGLFAQVSQWWPAQLTGGSSPQTRSRWAWLAGAGPAVHPAKGSSDDLIAAFERRLDGTRVGLSNVIDITYSASEPELAAKIANAIADAYLSEQWEAKSEASRVELAWLQKRLTELGQQTLDSERAVNKFRVLNNIVTVGGSSIDEQRIKELNTRLVAARAQTSEAQARMHRYESVLGSDPGQLSASNADLDAPIADALTNPIINTLRQQYLEYARRSSEWTARFGKKHQAVVNLRIKMHDIRESIAAELRRLAEASKNDYMVSKQREQAIEAQLVKAVTESRATDATEAKLRELTVSAKSYRTLYENFLQQYMRTVQQQSFPVANARVISAAAPPPGKSKPKSLLIMALALAGGGALGVALGLFRDLTDRVFRTTSQVESSLDTKCVSIVPMLEEPHSRNRLAAKNGPGRLIVRGSDRFWAATQKPLSHFAESIRFIDLAINKALSFTSSKVVGITSTVPNEGKTTIAAATAALIAQRGKRVIIVDCDLRNPSLSRRLTPEAPSGLVEVITGKCPLHETVWHDSKTNLTFLPLVTDPTRACAGDVLLVEGAEALFEELRRNYDYIIVDLPPLSPVVDVRTTTPWIDGFLLTVEWGRTKIDLVQHALHLAPDVREALIGVVLNKTDMKAIRRYDACQYYQRGYTDALARAA
jgi:exopolysaccharide transport family protein